MDNDIVRRAIAGNEYGNAVLSAGIISSAGGELSIHEYLIAIESTTLSGEGHISRNLTVGTIGLYGNGTGHTHTTGRPVRIKSSA